MISRQLTVALLSVFLLSSCMPGMTGPTPEQKAKRLALQESIDSIKIGNSRKSVEAKLGAPTSITESADSTVATYMLGLDGVMEEAQSQAMSAQKRAIGMGILSSAMGSLGMFGNQGTAMAGSIGSQAVGMGSQIAAQESMAQMADPTQMQNVTITYKRNKVVSIQRTNLGQM